MAAGVVQLMQAVYVHIHTAEGHRAFFRPAVPAALVGIAILHIGQDIKVGKPAQPELGQEILVHGEHHKAGNDAGHHPEHHTVDDVNDRDPPGLNVQHQPDEDHRKEQDVADMLHRRHHEQKRYGQQKCDETDRKLLRRGLHDQHAQQIQLRLESIHQPVQQQTVILRKHHFDRQQHQTADKREEIISPIGAQRPEPAEQADDDQQKDTGYDQIGTQLLPVVLADLRQTGLVLFRFQPGIEKHLM